MHRRHAAVLLACALTLLAACGQALSQHSSPPVETTAAPVTERADAAIEDAQSVTAQVVGTAVAAVRQAVQAVVPPPVEAEPPLVSPAAAALIVRWEVTSPEYYTRRLQRCIWPGGASGVTCGVGYDLGHATPQIIVGDWEGHPDARRLATAAGLTGQAARVALPRYRDIVTPWPLAYQVFVDRSLPVYKTSTRRAYGPAFDQLPPDPAGALVSNTYNRGGSMVGIRNRHKRHIRDVCLPAQDLWCLSVQLRAQCELWEGTPLYAGLCGRRNGEADLVVSAL